MSYIGNSLTQQSFTGGMDQFNGNASNTTFGLSRPVNTPFDINVFVESVFQRPGVAYTTSANTITFTSAPSAGANNIVVVYENFTSTSVVPAPGSVSTSSLGLISNINAGPNTGLTLQANSATSVTLDVYGNVGVGNQTYPLKNMSGASGPQVQIGSAVLGSQGPAQTLLGSNFYINSGGTNSYIAAGKSARYMMSAGGHYWSAANTGTADAAITYATVMSQGGPGYSVALEGASSVAGVGISFPATQVPSSDANTLDDYEEGSWTPTLSSDGTAPTMTYGTNSGQYVKIGRFVLVQWQIYVSTYNGNGSGNVTLNGLPFQPNNAGGISIASAAYWTTAPVAGELSVGSAIIYLLKSLQNNTRSVVADLYTGTNSAFNYFRGTACYWTTA